MSVISAGIIAKIAQAAESEGLDRGELMAASGLDYKRLVDPAEMVSEEAHYSTWELILSRLGSPGFPIRYARTVSVDDYGAFGLGVKTAPTLRGAMHRAHRYLVVLTNTSWIDLSETETGGRIIFRRDGARRLGMRCANEAAIAELVGTTRETCGVQFRPEVVRFRHRAPSDIAEHERFFGCPVLFDQKTDCIDIDRALLDLPLIRADDGLSRFLLNHLDELIADVDAEPTLIDSLRNMLSDALPDGAPVMDDFAKRLGMSRRTLSRRLAESNTTFQQLVERTRQEVSKQLLNQTRHSLTEVAFLLGFSEQSAFQRAFKRWTGQTPAGYRASSLGT